MSKIPINSHNAFDIYLIKLSEQFFPLFDKYKIKPNHITYVSIAAALGSIYFLFIDHCPAKAIALFLLQYLLDCWDGHYARYSNQETELGDKLDHFKDIAISGAIYLYLYKNWKIDIIYFYILLLLSALTLVHYSCIDNYYFHIKNPMEWNYEKMVLSRLQNLCYIRNADQKKQPELKRDIRKMLDIFSIFGNGTVVVYLCLLIYLNNRESFCGLIN
jgi:hypothetical protein